MGKNVSFLNFSNLKIISLIWVFHFTQGNALFRFFMFILPVVGYMNQVSLVSQANSLNEVLITATTDTQNDISNQN